MLFIVFFLVLDRAAALNPGESEVPSAVRWDPGPHVSVCNAALRGLFFMFSLRSVNIQPTSNQPVQSCSLTLCRTSGTRQRKHLPLRVFDCVGKHMFLLGRFRVPVEPAWKQMIIPPRWHTVSMAF